MSGRALCNHAESSRNAIAFVDAIGLAEIDPLGYRPDQVRRRLEAALESAQRSKMGRRAY